MGPKQFIRMLRINYVLARHGLDYMEPMSMTEELWVKQASKPGFEAAEERHHVVAAEIGGAVADVI